MKEANDANLEKIPSKILLLVCHWRQL